jgi:phospholipid/cholesterol/gamma-HCH transport system ATP-binding protein
MISVRDLHKAFDGAPVLNGVSFDVAKGESLVVIGGSGAGKSVLLRCILGLERLDAGSIRVDGTPGIDLGRVGMLFQGAALFDSLPVWENVAFRILQGPLSRMQSKERAVETLRRVGLSPDVADKYPAELSGGMRKRVGLARAIADDPDIIFFDEPTTGLDPIKARVINDLIREVVAQMGATTITITHDMSSVHAIADRVAMLHAGRVQWIGARAAMAGADDPYLQQFIAGATDGPIPTLR